MCVPCGLLRFGVVSCWCLGQELLGVICDLGRSLCAEQRLCVLFIAGSQAWPLLPMHCQQLWCMILRMCIG